ncbi:DUF6611 family protein [Leifsonia sp. NPDC058230]|uniref:DUF6611 family protein n=1 Tax=Leifsonia sp. NPDC058230 TaxID=3346391 RepID=UPI0036DCFD26
MHILFQKLTEGAHPWGTVDVSPAGRGAWQRVRLTVYPPGTTAGERRALTFAHAWPILGAVLAVLLLAPLGSAWPAPLVLVTMLVVYVAGFWVGARITRPIRGRLRSLTTATVYLSGEVQEFGNLRLLRETLAEFDRIDALRRRGELTPVQYEAEWSAIFDTLPASPELHAQVDERPSEKR